MNRVSVRSAIPTCESLIAIIQIFGFTGFIVPIASYSMVRSEFYNGANNEIKFVLESIFSVFIGSKLFFIYKIHSIMYESIVMLYYTAFLKWFIDLTYLNYMSLIFFSVFLSYFHLSTPFLFLYFAL